MEHEVTGAQEEGQICYSVGRHAPSQPQHSLHSLGPCHVPVWHIRPVQSHGGTIIPTSQVRRLRQLAEVDTYDPGLWDIPDGRLSPFLLSSLRGSEKLARDPGHSAGSVQGSKVLPLLRRTPAHSSKHHELHFAHLQRITFCSQVKLSRQACMRTPPTTSGWKPLNGTGRGKVYK